MARFIGIALGLLLSSSAYAQLPIPQLDGSGPALRFASANAFQDELRTFQRKLERIGETRRPILDRGRSEVRRQIRQFEQSLKPGAEVEAPEGFDILVAEKLVSALDQEEALLQQSADLARQALELSKRDPSPTPSDFKFDDLLQLAVRVRKLNAEAQDDHEAVGRLSALGLPAPSEPSSASLEVRLNAQENAVQAARLHRAQARELMTQARTREAKALLRVRSQHLQVTPQDAEAAKAALTKLQEETAKDLEKIKQDKTRLREHRDDPLTKRKLAVEVIQKLRAATRALRLARFDLLTRKEEALTIKVLRAKARYLTLRALARGPKVTLPEQFSRAKINQRLSKVERARALDEQTMSSLQLELFELPKNSPIRTLLLQRLEVLDQTQKLLLDTKEELDRISIMAELTLETQARPKLPTWLAVLLSMLVALGGLGLMRTGLQATKRTLSPEGGLGKKLLPNHAKRIDTGIALLWPLLVTAGCGALIVWPIWGLDVSLMEAIKAIDRPLFFVDESPVSVFSIIELLFAIWASVVLSHLIRDFLSTRVYKNLGWDIGLTNALNTLVHYATLLVGIIVGLRFVGIGLSSLAIFAGILGIGIGFGLRNITENFISGLIILAERPVKIGDFVEIEGKVEGQVRHIRARSTTVVTRDNISIIIPNSNFVSARVINWSHGDPKVRVGVPVGVVYGSDTDMVRKVLLEVATRHGQVLKKPAPEVQFRAFGASSLDFILLVWIEEQFHRFRIASDLHFAIDKAFRRVGLEIAFPQMDLHLKTFSGGVMEGMRELAQPPQPKESAVSQVLEQRLEQIRASWPQLGEPGNPPPKRAGSGPVPIPEAPKVGKGSRSTKPTRADSKSGV